MGSVDFSQDILAETLDVFAAADPPSAPLTTSEVADVLDYTRRAAYDRLNRLVERGDVETKKVGARGRVWWRPRTGAAEEVSDDLYSQPEIRELLKANYRAALAGETREFKARRRSIGTSDSRNGNSSTRCSPSRPRAISRTRRPRTRRDRSDW
ncbi:hypothetical protein [Haladaptatus halobius]|uniref:hypothetical protein n=1 Tax=Haladaptatus halobius TaxID=2884875 RepID=UPI001D0BBE57|nr:hypothetical protein [Haladaptatus halobius]